MDLINVMILSKKIYRFICLGFFVFFWCVYLYLLGFIYIGIFLWVIGNILFNIRYIMVQFPKSAKIYIAC